MKVCPTNNVQRERRVKFTGESVFRSELDSIFFQLEGKKICIWMSFNIYENSVNCLSSHSFTLHSFNYEMLLTAGFTSPGDF